MCAVLIILRECLKIPKFKTIFSTSFKKIKNKPELQMETYVFNWFCFRASVGRKPFKSYIWLPLVLLVSSFFSTVCKWASETMSSSYTVILNVSRETKGRSSWSDISSRWGDLQFLFSPTGKHSWRVISSHPARSPLMHTHVLCVKFSPVTPPDWLLDVLEASL